MFKRKFAVSGLLNLDYEGDSSLGTPEGKGLARVLERDGVHVLEITIGTTLGHPTAKLSFLIRVVKIDDRPLKKYVRGCGDR